MNLAFYGQGEHVQYICTVRCEDFIVVVKQSVVNVGWCGVWCEEGKGGCRVL